MKQPLVSVIIPFYSGANWLNEALLSVQKQTYKNMEVLVINDGSVEDISDIIDKYDLSITIINKTNGGPASARNKGIDNANGKYVAFLDSDDLWLPDKLEKQITEMEMKNYIWSQHSYEMFWEDGNKTKVVNTNKYSGFVYRDCYISFKVQTSCVVVLRSILINEKIRFPINKRYGQDGDFYKQIAKKYPLGYIDGILSRFRIRGSNAGFRASVQINDRARTWCEIKGDEETLKVLPLKVILAYKIAYFSNSWFQAISNRITKNDKILELFAKCLYLLPYALFKSAC